MRGRTQNDKLPHAGKKPNDYGSYVCKECGEEFRLKYSLLTHKCAVYRKVYKDTIIKKNMKKREMK